MNKAIIIGIIICSLLYSLGCNSQKQQDKSIESNIIMTGTYDTIKSIYFSSILNEDSIRLLNFEKSKYDTIEEESIKYIDFKKINTTKERIAKLNIDSLAKTSKKYIEPNGATKISLKEKYPELIGLYVPVEKYENNFCMYYFDIEFYNCLSDSLYISESMEGLQGFYYSSIIRNNKNILINFCNNFLMTSIEIKFLEDKYNSAIWRITTNYDQTESVSYRWVVPASNISEIPILYTLFSSGLDDVFDGFDRIPLKELFNK